MRLTIDRHDRDTFGLTYVYPVVSRRAGGVSIGINLNPNNACNWRCVYCQVPDLVFGSAPPIDLERLEAELTAFLDWVVRGDFMESHVGEGARTLKDVAFSGNGEPTSSPQLAEAIDVVLRVLDAFELRGTIDVVLITNGSLVHKAHVRRGLTTLASARGVVWFKVDSATQAGQQRMNTIALGPERTRANLEIAARLCPTWIQTMMLAIDGAPPSHVERAAYLEFLRALVRDRVPVRGVLLYGLARASYQPEAPRLSALSLEWMEQLAREIEATGLTVRLSP